MVTGTAPEAYRDEGLPPRHRRYGVPRWYEAGDVPRGEDLDNVPDVGIRLDVSFVSTCFPPQESPSIDWFLLPVTTVPFSLLACWYCCRAFAPSLIPFHLPSTSTGPAC